MSRRTSHRRDEIAVPPRAIPYVYKVVIEPDEDRYYAEIPKLPGCYSWGYTWEEALKNIKEAIEVWLEVKREEGETIPVEDPQTIWSEADLRRLKLI